jgi:endoglucanase
MLKMTGLYYPGKHKIKNNFYLVYYVTTVMTLALKIRTLLFSFCIVLLFSNCRKNNITPLPPDKENYTTDTSYRTPLSKGINLSNWFNDYSDHSQFSNRFTDAHFTLLKQLGFTYVRIPVGQYVLFNREKPSELNPVNLQYVESAVQKAINNGLAVTLNYHTASDDFEKTLPTNTANQDKLATYWKAVANYFKKYGTSEIFFEVYNEPHIASNGTMPGTSKTWWTTVQEKIIKTIRTVDNDHFIIAGGESWNSIDALRLLKPYKVDNVIYNFHFYDPFTFTHQGATWAGELMTKLRGIPYPSSPENVKPITDTATDTQVKELINWYGQEEWNKEKLAALIQRAVDWANENNAAIICNEFGSYLTYAPRQSRLDLLNDVRSIFDEKNIGWAMWEMDEGFGFINYAGNDRSNFTTDDEVLHSLGLK